MDYGRKGIVPGQIETHLFRILPAVLSGGYPNSLYFKALETAADFECT
jgi:hypothetical protein